MKTGWSFTGCLSASKLELQLLSVWRSRVGGKGLSCTHGCQNSWASSSVYFSFQKLFLIKGLGGAKGKGSTGKKERKREQTITVKSVICIIWGIRWYTIFILRVDTAFCIWASEPDVIQLFNSGMSLCIFFSFFFSDFKKTCLCAFELVDLLNTNGLALKNKGYFLSQLIVNKIVSILKKKKSIGLQDGIIKEGLLQNQGY